jgi:oligopeptidase B
MIRFAAICGLAILTMSCGDTVKPPVAKKIPKKMELHGDLRVDDYYWLRDKKDPDTVAYLEAENKYLEAVMKPTEALQAKLYEELKSRIKETDMAVPERKGPYLYYSRTEEGKQYSIYCRKGFASDAKEEILLDGNVLAEGKKYFNIGAFEVSPNHQLLAYSIDDTGGEKLVIRVKNLKTGELLPDVITNAQYDLEWANDNRTLYYINQDEAQRPYQLKRHTIGAAPSDDPVIYEETDETFRVGIGKTRSEQYLVMSLVSTMSSEMRIKDAASAGGDFAIMEPRKKDTLYFIEHQGGDFYIRTNENDQKNFALMKTPVARPARANWQTVIPHNRAESINDIDGFRDHLVVTRRVKGLIRLDIRNTKTGARHEVEMPEPVYSVFVTGNPEYDSATLRFSYMSLVTPRSVFDYEMNTKTRTLMKQYEVLGGYDPSQYVSERLYAKASDGVEIPVSVVYKKGLKRDGSHPALLYGYGSYGSSSDVTFNSDRLSLLDRGFVYAIAHIRGGGDLGRYWYEDGKKFTKKNTFTDFIACAEYLVANKYTSPAKFAAFGGSAGGLLMGAVVNMRPELFRAVIAKVPFVDVVTTMLDATIPLTAQEWDEWGNPANLEYYRYMKSYSPYDNVQPVKYPDLLITTGLNDPRVAFWEPAKWAAKLRATAKPGGLILLKTEMGAGHGGPSGRYERWKETAFDYAFLLTRLGVDR